MLTAIGVSMTLKSIIKKITYLLYTTLKILLLFCFGIFLLSTGLLIIFAQKECVNYPME